MAISGSKTITVNGAGGIEKINLIFSWQVLETSIYNNTSTINWSFNLENPSIIGMVYTGSEHSWYVKIDGVTVSQGKNKPSIKGKSKINVASGIYTITHNADGAKTFSFEVFQRMGAPLSIGDARGTGTGTLDAFYRGATLTAVPKDLTDEQNPQIHFNNPTGDKATKLQLCICYLGSEGNPEVTRNLNRGGASSASITLTADERKKLREGFSTYPYDSRKIKYILKSEVDGIAYEDAKTDNLVLVNYMPTLAPTVAATDARTKTLTGDSSGNTLIKYYSDVNFTVGAAARKEAFINSRKIICGNKTFEDYASDAGSIEDIDSNTFYFSATDSRGKTVNDAIVFNGSNGRNFVDYVKLTNNIQRAVLSASNVLTVTIGGKYFNSSFGAKNNTLEVEYTLIDESGNPVFNESGSGWVRLGAVTPEVDDDNNYTFTFAISGVDYKKQYTLTVNTIDEITPVQTVTKVIASIPVFDWGKNDFKHNTDVVIANNKSIIGTRSDGSTFRAIEPCNGSGNTVINWDSYDQGSSDTEVYGKNVKVTAKEKVYINNMPYGENKVLWQGHNYMNGAAVITLNEPISAQPNGIVLVFSIFRDGAAQNVSINSFFVSKKEVELLPGAPHTFIMGINSGFSNIGAKYIYISDTQLTGTATNTDIGTNSGISFSNASYVLRYVIGV